MESAHEGGSLGGGSADEGVTPPDPRELHSLLDALRAAAAGDFTVRLPHERFEEGLLPEIARAFNLLVGQNEALVLELARLEHVAGDEGRVGERASLEAGGGGWTVAIASVNGLLAEVTSPLVRTGRILGSLADGDLMKDLSLVEDGVSLKGDLRELEVSLERLIDRLRFMSTNLTGLTTQMGTEGRLGLRAEVDGLRGTWRELTESVNMLAGNLTAQVRNIALVTTAVANGDLSQKITIDAQGEVEELKETINAMVDRLRTFASEVTRVAREVGTEGQLGGQARVPDVSGTWKNLTDNVNLMASNLTDQVRGISRVVTAVANGDLAQRLTLVARGEIATLADTINGMTDTLRTFSDQVTTVAREVGTEGKLGGQAMVPRASGTWRDLTDNVNRLAANLTTQVRAISEVATAVTEGDLSRNISVEALGELAALKDTINQMISNLRDTTRANMEQDWLKGNLARFFALMQGQQSLESFANQIISQLTPVVGAQQGAFYFFDEEDEELRLMSTYASIRRHQLASRFRLGQGLVGQCGLEKKPILVENVPEDYIRIQSGLGEAPPREIGVFPVLYEESLKGVVELATFEPFTDIQINFIEQLSLNMGLAINLITASMRMEQVLQQLQGSNLELDDRRKELEEKAQLLEVRNREVADASDSLQDKARELERVSRYKSEFLANMSHEIRTPLNSMLILAQMLAANEDGRLSERQVEWASTIHSAGKDLLVLINQVLDLSKVESGRLEAQPERCALDWLEHLLERTFRPVALQKGLGFTIERSEKSPDELRTDRQLLSQILLNLLSNAFKFTSEGRVRLEIEPSNRLGEPGLAFCVTDTGIGIPKGAQLRIFEAFSQADGSITRSFEGTGLGLAISQEYAHLLGGMIEVESDEGKGSTFTLVVPIVPGARRSSVEGRLSGILPPPPRSPPAQDRREAPSGRGGPAAAEGDGEFTKSDREPAEDEDEAEPATRDPRALRGKRVLIVEDDVRNLYATTALLESLGMVVDQAKSASEGFRKLREGPAPAVILMDVMMPEIDGYQAITRIRSMPGSEELPIIVFSAKASRSDRRRALQVGADDFVLKPVEIDGLAGAILRSLRKERRAPATQSDDAAVPAQAAEEDADEDSHNAAIEELNKAVERRYRSLADAVPNIVWTADETGTVDYYNRRWHEFSGLSAEEGVQPWFSIVAPEDRERCLRDWREALSSGTTFEGEFRLRRVDGALRWHLCRALPERGQSGAVIAWLGTLTDISEQKEAERERERLYLQAVKALQARDEFVSEASHELRTPVTSLGLVIETLLRKSKAGHLSDEQLMEKLDSAARQVDKLTRLIAELLDVSRMKAGEGGLELERETFDLRELVREIVARFAEDAAQVGSPLTLDARLPAVGCWDRLRVDQAVTNLLTNALKFGAGEPVEVSLERSSTSVTIKVRDHGIGIAEEDRARIFERFTRADAARPFGGMGLGLYIVRQIVDAHGGALDVVSEPRSGSCFILSLPLNPPPERPLG